MDEQSQDRTGQTNPPEIDPNLKQNLDPSNLHQDERYRLANNPETSIEVMPEVTPPDDSAVKLSLPHHKKRMGLLAILVGGGLLILGRSLFDGNLGKPTPYAFPESIEFGQNQIKLEIARPPEAIVDSKEFFGKPRYITGKGYRYLIDQIPVEIDIRYASGTEGDLHIFLKEMAAIDISEDDLRQKSSRNTPTGFHAIIEHQNRTYLTACINPRGISTVTKDQFDDNASARASDRDVVVGWLLGQTDLRDRRCLWTLMSTPSTPDASQKLEKVWVLWYEWWKPKFPQV